MTPVVLPHGEIHVWLLPRPAVVDDRLLPWVFPAEQARVDTMQSAARRAEWLAGRALLRACLAHYTGKSSSELLFTVTEAGKPCLDITDAPAFSLSHGGRWIGCAVAHANTIGLDMDCTARRNDTAAIASRFFHPLEQQSLAEADDPHREFFFHWALKEAYIKALGSTIAGTHLDRLPFVREGGKAAAKFVPEGQHWEFRHGFFDGDHPLALACQWRQCDTDGLPSRCRLWQWDPLIQALRDCTDQWLC